MSVRCTCSGCCRHAWLIMCRASCCVLRQAAGEDTSEKLACLSRIGRAGVAGVRTCPGSDAASSLRCCGGSWSLRTNLGIGASQGSDRGPHRKMGCRRRGESSGVNSGPAFLRTLVAGARARAPRLMAGRRAAREGGRHMRPPRGARGRAVGRANLWRARFGSAGGWPPAWRRRAPRALEHRGRTGWSGPYIIDSTPSGALRALALRSLAESRAHTQRRHLRALGAFAARPFRVKGSIGGCRTGKRPPKCAEARGLVGSEIGAPRDWLRTKFGATGAAFCEGAEVGRPGTPQIACLTKSRAGGIEIRPKPILGRQFRSKRYSLRTSGRFRASIFEPTSEADMQGEERTGIR